MSDVATFPDDPALDVVSGWGRRVASVFRALGFLILYAVVVGALTLAAGPVRQALSHAGGGGHVSLTAVTSDPTTTTVVEAISILSALLAAAIMSFRARMSLRDAGFGRVDVGKGLGVGAALGLGLLTAIMLVLIALGNIHLAPFDLHGPEAPLWLARFVILFGAVALNEELMMRGPMMTLFGRAFGFWPAATITSVIFMALHIPNPGETPMGLFNVFLVGMALAWSRRRTGALWLAIGFHAAWDFAQSYVFGVPDSGAMMNGAITRATISGPDWLSGGLTGPEGGVLTSLSTIGFVLVVNAFWPKGKAASAP